ncbi:MAG: helix-turn-helix transcriptional regulator [Sedimentisphaerales bacterium]|nr:helix-turn-helix transcriptional regulator [Sedimentisphaerales bacterium]
MQKTIYSGGQDELLRLLRETRKHAGLSQSQVARLLGRSQSFVSKYETGQLRLDLVELRAVCHALNTSLSAFVREFEKRTL